MGADKRRAPQMEPDLKNMKPEHLSGLTWCFVDQTQPVPTSWMDSFTAALLPTMPQQDLGVCRTLSALPVPPGQHPSPKLTERHASHHHEAS